MPDISLRAHLVYPPAGEVLEKKKKVLCAFMEDMELYFRVGDVDDGETDAAGWQDVNTTHPIRIRIYYYDEGTEAITVTYTDDGTTEYTETVVTKGNTGVWKRAHHTLAHNARFNHSLYEDFNNADFYLACDDGVLYIGEVLVKDTTTKVAALWQATDDPGIANLEMQSDNYVAATTGWAISGDAGDAEFNNVTVRGTIYATAGEIGGFHIDSVSIHDAADTFGLASTGTAGDDVRFWAGSTYANRATSSTVRIYESGDFFLGDSDGGNLTYDVATGVFGLRRSTAYLLKVNASEDSITIDNPNAGALNELYFQHTGAPDANSYAAFQFDATNATKVLSLNVYNGTVTRTWTFGSDQTLTVPNSGHISELACLNGSLTASAGNNNNVATAGVSTILCTNSPGNFTITGFAGAYEGKFLTFIYTGSNNVTISNADGASDAGNRIVMSDASSPVSTGVSYFLFQYLNSRWRLLSQAL